MRRIVPLATVLGLLAASAAAYAMMNMSTHEDGASAAATQGDWPTLDQALHSLTRLGPIHIRDRGDFNAAHGVRGGSGTASDPYVLSDFYTPSLVIRNVSAAVTIHHLYVSGEMVLDWTGADARVDDSWIGELKTNTNHAHDTPATWGVFEGNRLGDVDFRHIGGALLRNDIGPLGPIDASRLSLNVEGYNGFRVANNTVRGPAEFRLHGHHYSDSFESAWMSMDMMGRGSAEDRYHALVVEGNRFLDPTGRGVAISDQNHAGNDRTASSEPDPALNGTHRHFTRIVFGGNEIRGAGLVIENADSTDKHHEAGGVTRIDLTKLTIADPLSGVAVAIRGSHGANVTLADSEMRMHGEVNRSVGVLLSGIDGGSVILRNDTIQGYETGVKAEHVSKSTTWSVIDVRFVDVAHDVSWDASVRATPRREAADGQPAAEPSGENDKGPMPGMK